MKKRFDCVEMKRRGAERIYNAVKDMTVEEELAYWQRRDQEFAQKLPARRRQLPRRGRKGAADGRVYRD